MTDTLKQVRNFRTWLEHNVPVLLNDNMIKMFEQIEVALQEQERERGDGPVFVNTQWITDRFGFLEGLVNENTYRKIVDEVVDIIQSGGYSQTLRRLRTELDELRAAPARAEVIALRSELADLRSENKMLTDQLSETTDQFVALRSEHTALKNSLATTNVIKLRDELEDTKRRHRITEQDACNQASRVTALQKKRDDLVVDYHAVVKERDTLKARIRVARTYLEP